MSNSANWYGVDKTQRLVPLTEDDLFGPLEPVEPPERLTLEKIPTTTDVIRISIKKTQPIAIIAPPPPRRRGWIAAAAVALAAIIAAACLF